MSNIDSTPGSRPSKRRNQNPARKSRSSSTRTTHPTRLSNREWTSANIEEMLQEFALEARPMEDCLRSEGILTGGEVEELTRLWTLDAPGSSNGAAL